MRTRKEQVVGRLEKADLIVPDTSVVIDGLISKKIFANQFKTKKIIIHEAVIAELESQANKNRETGELGLEEIKKLRESQEKFGFEIVFKGSRPNDFEIRHAKSGEIDSLIRQLAMEEHATLVTADKVQAKVAESKGIPVLFFEFEFEEKPLSFEKYFDKDTMSVHLKENCTPKAKRGVPGNWEYVVLGDEKLDFDTMASMAKEIVEEAAMRKDSFLEINRRNTTIAQIAAFRIVTVKPPLSDAYEITIVKPIKKLSLNDYSLSEKLMKRFEEQAEGVLISGAPGHGKSTFAQSLAEFYAAKKKTVKTIEAPRDLILSDEITQYALSHASSAELHDILLLSRPDYTIFDEMRNTDDFKLFSDLRLSGVGMIGVIHATKPIDAIQRFIGRIELGVIPHIIDTIIFIQDGMIKKVFSITMQVKVPSGMIEADLARPVVVVNDYDTGKLEFEIYSYGEETVVIPVTVDSSTPVEELAEKMIENFFRKYADSVRAEIISGNKCAIYVPKKDRPGIIGREGKNIEEFERKLRMSIDVREAEFSKKDQAKRDSSEANYEVAVKKNSIVFFLGQNCADKDAQLFVSGDYLLTARASKKAVIKISRNNKIGSIILNAIQKNEKIELRL
ncbi:MAG: PINc/VapC family ATPase [Candidatus Woesearchaeota archaeon]